MINNIRFKIIAGKINKIPEFYTIFARKMPDYIIRQRDRGQAEAKCLRPRLRGRSRGQNLDAEAKDEAIATTPKPRTGLWCRGRDRDQVLEVEAKDFLKATLASSI